MNLTSCTNWRNHPDFQKFETLTTKIQNRGNLFTTNIQNIRNNQSLSNIVKTMRMNSERKRTEGDLKSYVSEAFKDISKFFGMFVLSGDYVKCFESLEQITTEIERVYRHAFVVWGNVFLVQQIGADSELMNQHINFLKNYVNKLVYLNNYYQKLPNQSFSDFDMLNKYFKKLEPESSISLLLNLLKIEYIDFELTLSSEIDEVLSDLSEVITFLLETRNINSTDDTINKISKFALEKCLFICEKIKIHKSENRVERETINLVLDEKIETLSELFVKHPIGERTQKFLDIARLYDDVSITEETLPKINEMVEYFSNCSCIKNYIDVKKYKDNRVESFRAETVRYNLNQIERISNTINFNDEFIYDRLAGVLNKIFILNNYISLSHEFLKEINEENIFIDDEILQNLHSKVEEIYTEIIRLEHSNINKFKVENYFSQYKYLKYKYQEYFKRLKEPNKYDFDAVKSDILEITGPNGILKDLLKRFLNLQRFQRYRINFEDSFIGENKDIFVYSGLNLPFYFNEQQELIEFTKIETASLVTEMEKVDIEMKTKKSILNISSIANEIDKKIEKSQVKSTEILAIFAALAFFTSGSIQLFSSVTEPVTALALMMCFGTTIIFIFAVIRAMHSRVNTVIKKRLNIVLKNYVKIVSLLFLMALFIHGKPLIPREIYEMYSSFTVLDQKTTKEYRESRRKDLTEKSIYKIDSRIKDRLEFDMKEIESDLSITMKELKEKKIKAIRKARSEIIQEIHKKYKGEAKQKMIDQVLLIEKEMGI